MNKIEQIAKEYCQGSSFDDACMMKPAYIAGANAVLKEIEGVLPHLAKNGVIYSILKDKIKELKGE